MPFSITFIKMKITIGIFSLLVLCAFAAPCEQRCSNFCEWEADHEECMTMCQEALCAEPAAEAEQPVLGRDAWPASQDLKDDVEAHRAHNIHATYPAQTMDEALKEVNDFQSDQEPTSTSWWSTIAWILLSLATVSVIAVLIRKYIINKESSEVLPIHYKRFN